MPASDVNEQHAPTGAPRPGLDATLADLNRPRPRGLQKIDFRCRPPRARRRREESNRAPRRARGRDG